MGFRFELAVRLARFEGRRTLVVSDGLGAGLKVPGGLVLADIDERKPEAAAKSNVVG